MPRFFYLILSLALPLSLSGQDWKLFNKEWIYSYDHDANGVFDFSLQIDSTYTLNSDSVYCFNPYLVPCDTCAINIDCGFCFSYNAYKWEYGPIGQSMIFGGDSVFLCSDEDTLLIRSNLLPGDSWAISTANSNWIAQLDSIKEETVLGSVDSVRYFSISNDGKFSISKLFGLLSVNFTGQSETLQLKGIQGPDIGDYELTFEEVFSFDVGDVFQYFRGWGYSAQQSSWYTKRTILEKQVVESGFIYLVEDRMMGFTSSNYIYGHLDTLPDWTVGGHLIDTLYVEFNKSDFKNIGLTGQLHLNIADLPDIIGGAETWPGLLVPTEDHGRRGKYSYRSEAFNLEPSMQYDSQDTALITFNFESGFNPVYFYPEMGSSFWVAHGTGAYYSFPNSNNSQFFSVHQGLGITSYSIPTDLSGLDFRLMGFVHLGDTTGLVFPDYYFVDNIDEVGGANFILYPNPAHDWVQMDFPLLLGAIKYSIQIRNIDGRIVNSLKSSDLNNEHLWVGNLSSGMYLIEIIYENGRVSYSILVISDE
jgi:hypothetical protein